MSLIAAEYHLSLRLAAERFANAKYRPVVGVAKK